MTWGRGRDTVERLLRDGELEQVLASPELAERLMEDAAARQLLGTGRLDRFGLGAG